MERHLIKEKQLLKAIEIHERVLANAKERLSDAQKIYKRIEIQEGVLARAKERLAAFKAKMEARGKHEEKVKGLIAAAKAKKAAPAAPENNPYAKRDEEKRAMGIKLDAKVLADLRSKTPKDLLTKEGFPDRRKTSLDIEKMWSVLDLSGNHESLIDAAKKAKEDAKKAKEDAKAAERKKKGEAALAKDKAYHAAQLAKKGKK